MPNLKNAQTSHTYEKPVVFVEKIKLVLDFYYLTG